MGYTNPMVRLASLIHPNHRHWHYIYKRRRKGKNISSFQITVGHIIAMSGSLLAGLLLDLNKETLGLFAGAFLLLPGTIDLAASITGAMCAKINHRLEEDEHTFRVIETSIGFALILSLCAGLIVGVVGGAIGELFFDSTFWQICVLAVSTMMIVGLITYPIMSLLTLFVRKIGVDPDNVVGPIETGFTDALTVTVVTLIVRMFV